MSVEKLNDRIISYRLYDEKSTAVLYYTLNLDRYSLTIGGETSGYYKWVETPKTESFLELMFRCDKWYITNKLFKKQFDLKKSIEKVKEYIEEYDLFDTDYEEEEKNVCIEEIEEIDVNCGSRFVEKVIEILKDYNKDSYDIEEDMYNRIEFSYKYWQEKAVELFCERIKPELLKE